MTFYKRLLVVAGEPKDYLYKFIVVVVAQLVAEVFVD